MSASVFGVPIEGYGLPEIGASLALTTQAWIVTANPEIILEARRNQAYADVLRQASIRTVDGFGLWLMLRFTGHKTARVSGIALADQLMSLADKRGWRVGLVGGGSSVAEIAKQSLIKKYSTLQVLSEEGGQVDRTGQDDAAGEEARYRLTMFNPEVLLVAFGHPKQELWISKYKDSFPNLKVIVGVGGTFDVWAGRVKRAPRWMQAVGLEWLWRLLIEPKRIRRIWNAVVVFPLTFLFASTQSQ